MSRAIYDVRVWLPLALAVTCVAIRERGWSAEAIVDRPVVSTELPVPRVSAQPKGEQTYELDVSRSFIRFLVDGSGRELLVSCSVASGTLELSPEPGKCVLELRVDLGSLAPVTTQQTPTSEPELQHLLGVHRGSEVVYRATLLSSASSPVPGLSYLTWLGTLRFGNRVLRQPMALWQTAMPGQPLRLQGHGTVGADTYGLPRRSWLGLVEERHDVTLGVDLAWKRRLAR